MSEYQSTEYKYSKDANEVDVADRADRDVGKVDVASADATLPVEQQTSVDVATPAPIDVTATTVPVSLNGGGGVDVIDRTGRDFGKARLMDAGGTLVSPLDADEATTATATDSGTGSAGAASVTVGSHRRLVAVHAATTGDATLTIEVSADGGATWLGFESVTLTGATEQVEQFDCAFDDVRAYLDQNRYSVTVSAKGL